MKIVISENAPKLLRAFGDKKATELHRTEALVNLATFGKHCRGVADLPQWLAAPQMSELHVLDDGFRGMLHFGDADLPEDR